MGSTGIQYSAFITCDWRLLCVPHKAQREGGGIIIEQLMITFFLTGARNTSSTSKATTKASTIALEQRTIINAIAW